MNENGIVQINDWKGLISGLRDDEADVDLAFPGAVSERGGSSPFIGISKDGDRYWIKPVNNHHHPMLPAIEQIVARVGSLFGAPVCDVKRIRIGEEFDGFELETGYYLEPGIAHASLDILDSFEIKIPSYFREADNMERYSYIQALFDWCWGDDRQWLISPNDEKRIFSHDHGFYFPPPGQGIWDNSALEHCVDTAHALSLPVDVFKPTAFTYQKVASALSAISRPDIIEVLAMIPVSWAVTDEDLEYAGFFIERRIRSVAKRISHI